MASGWGGGVLDGSMLGKACFHKHGSSLPGYWSDYSPQKCPLSIWMKVANRGQGSMVGGGNPAYWSWDGRCGAAP